MSKEELLGRLTALLEKYESYITEAEQWKQQGVQGVHPAFFSGQIDILVTACTDLEALLLEAAGVSRECEITGLAERHESEGRP